MQASVVSSALRGGLQRQGMDASHNPGCRRRATAAAAAAAPKQDARCRSSGAHPNPQTSNRSLTDGLQDAAAQVHIGADVGRGSRAHSVRQVVAEAPAVGGQVVDLDLRGRKQVRETCLPCVCTMCTSARSTQRVCARLHCRVPLALCATYPATVCRTLLPPAFRPPKR